MPYAPPKHCPRPGHAPFTARVCPACRAASDARRPTARQRGYGAKWDKARREFLAANPQCSCGAPATVVDHIIAHKGDQRLFWSRSNWQPLCRACHGRKTYLCDGAFGR